MLILGEETVMGSPVLRTMWEIVPYILLLWLVLASIAVWIIWLWEKKHPPKSGGQQEKGDRDLRAD